MLLCSSECARFDCKLNQYRPGLSDEDLAGAEWEGWREEWCKEFEPMESATLEEDVQRRRGRRSGIVGAW